LKDKLETIFDLCNMIYSDVSFGWRRGGIMSYIIYSQSGLDINKFK